jgi:hypothetical protein
MLAWSEAVDNAFINGANKMLAQSDGTYNPTNICRIRHKVCHCRDQRSHQTLLFPRDSWSFIPGPSVSHTTLVSRCSAAGVCLYVCVEWWSLDSGSEQEFLKRSSSFSQGSLTEADHGDDGIGTSGAGQDFLWRKPCWHMQGLGNLS